MADKKKLNSPFAPNGVEYAGQGDFDTTYKSIKIVDTVKKTGEGEDDYIIVKKVIVEEQPIQEVIDADADSVGVYNIIRQVMRTGDESLLPMDNGQCQVDLVGAPENLMQLKQMGIDAEALFASLPAELKGDMDYATFVNSMTDEKLQAFIASLTQAQGGEGEKKHE